MNLYKYHQNDRKWKQCDPNAKKNNKTKQNKKQSAGRFSLRTKHYSLQCIPAIKGIQVCSNKKPSLFVRGDNYKKVLSSTSLLYLRMRYIILKITSVNLPMLNSRPFYLNENGALSICFNGPVCCFKDTKLGTMVGIMEKKNLHFHFFLSKDQRQ